MNKIVKTGREFIEFIWTTSICHQVPANDNLNTNGLWQRGLEILKGLRNDTETN